MKVQTKRGTIFYLGMIFLSISLFVIVGGYFFAHATFTLRKFVEDFYANIGAELGSIAVTLLIVDRVLKGQEQKEHEIQNKNKLLNDLHSPVNSIANNAVHELRTLGKLTGQDAWTISAKLGGKADLSNARRYDANFFDARLVGANFSQADLRNVNFCHADLTGAILFKSDIAGAKFDENTVLPDGLLWNKETDLSKYLNQRHAHITKNWLDQINISELHFDKDSLLAQPTRARDLIFYLQQRFPDTPIAENELHFFRHWTALVEYGYITIRDVDDLLARTEEAKNWIWKGRMPEYLIISISFSIALENPNHLKLPHWNERTKKMIVEARRRFYN